MYERIQSEIPNEAPKETPVQLEVTRYVDSEGNEVQETEEGTHQPPKLSETNGNIQVKQQRQMALRRMCMNVYNQRYQMKHRKRHRCN